MYEYGWRHDDFASIAINAYSNAARAGLAQGPPPSLDDYRAAPVVVDPLCSLDYALWVESAVAVILCSSEHVGRCAGKPVTVTGAAVATDARDLAQRADILWLKAVERSAADAYRQAGRRPQDMDLFEPTDDATIMAALSLEASGFARKGESLSLASDGAIMIGGARPMSTLGGLLGRGKADACRLVLVADVVRQLRGEGGANQVDGAHIGMAQIAGDDGSFAAAFILEA
jgi:acetyl-CoA C-acetyltransferase